MKPEQQRIAIATACGWRITHGDFFKYLIQPGETSGICCGTHLTDDEIFRGAFVIGECGPDYVIPDYLNDLNAMHEAEKLLTFDRAVWSPTDEYERTLGSICKIGITRMFPMVHATAAQRAEAFLRTIGKWSDDL